MTRKIMLGRVSPTQKHFLWWFIAWHHNESRPEEKREKNMINVCEETWSHEKSVSEIEHKTLAAQD